MINALTWLDMVESIENKVSVILQLGGKLDIYSSDKSSIQIDKGYILINRKIIYPKDYDNIILISDKIPPIQFEKANNILKKGLNNIKLKGLNNN